MHESLSESCQPGESPVPGTMPNLDADRVPAEDREFVEQPLADLIVGNPRVATFDPVPSAQKALSTDSSRNGHPQNAMNGILSSTPLKLLFGLGYAGGFGAAFLGLGRILAEYAQSSLLLLSPEFCSFDPSAIAKAALISLSVIPLKEMISKVSFRHGRVKCGNASMSSKSMKELFKKHSGLFLMMSLSIACVEEFFFRGLPAVALGRDGMTIPIGLGVSALFAASHNIIVDKHGNEQGVALSPRLPFIGQLKFSTNYAPATQFVGGFVYWELMKNFGFAAVIAGHAVNNLYAWFRRHDDKASPEGS